MKGLASFSRPEYDTELARPIKEVYRYYIGALYVEIYLLGRNEGAPTVSRRLDNRGEGLGKLLGASGEREVINAFGEDLVCAALCSISFTLRHDFLRIANVDGSVVNSRDGTTDVDQVETGVNTDNSKVLDSNLVSTHVASHLFARENPPRILCKVRIEKVKRCEQVDLPDAGQSNQLNDVIPTHHVMRRDHRSPISSSCPGNPFRYYMADEKALGTVAHRMDIRGRNTVDILTGNKMNSAECGS